MVDHVISRALLGNNGDIIHSGGSVNCVLKNLGDYLNK